MRIDAEVLFKKAKEQLKYPFSLNINPFMDPLAKETIIWLQKNGLLVNNNDYQKILSFCPWVLSSYACPSISYDLLSLITNWFSWIFLSDDEFSEKPIARDPLQISILFKDYRDTLFLKETERQNKFISPLRDIMVCISNFTDEKWLGQFRDNMDNYFEACLRESFYRASMEVPNVLEYCKLKVLSSAMLPIMDIVELSLSEKLSENFKNSINFEEIRYIVSNICAWANDIYSFPKKIKNGEPCNLLTSLMTHESLNFNKALDKAVMMHNIEIEKFLLLEKEISCLVSYDGNEKKKIQSWFEGLKSCMVGIWCWTLESGKYQLPLNDRINLVFFEDSSNERVPS
jgi:5-epi-alpha-selinene synthase